MTKQQRRLRAERRLIDKATTRRLTIEDVRRLVPSGSAIKNVGTTRIREEDDWR